MEISLSSDDGEWLDYIPQDIEPLIKEIGKTYLPYLNENVRVRQKENI